MGVTTMSGAGLAGGVFIAGLGTGVLAGGLVLVFGAGAGFVFGEVFAGVFALGVFTGGVLTDGALVLGPLAGCVFGLSVFTGGAAGAGRVCAGGGVSALGC